MSCNKNETSKHHFKDSALGEKLGNKLNSFCSVTMSDITAMDDLLVPLGQNNMLDPSTMGGQHFLLDATNLSRYTARECNDIPHVYG